MVIGMAGGVGSGKSTVLGLLEKQYPVCICMADELGHRAMEQGTDAFRHIVEEFGPSVLKEDGTIDRNVLAELVYREEQRLAILNGIIHPYVRQEIRRRKEQCPKDRVFVLETAILFETGCDELCDEVWGVLTEDEVRICRLMEGRGYSREKAEGIMKRQMSNEELAGRCDHIIVNDGDREELRQQIHKLWQNMLEKR